VILLGAAIGARSVVDASNLALFCTPAINRSTSEPTGSTSTTACTIPRRRRPNQAAGFRDLRRDRRRRHGIGTDSEQEFLPFTRHTAATAIISSPPTTRRAASRGWCRRPRSAADPVRATSEARSFSRSSIRRRRRSAAICGSSRSRRSAPIGSGAADADRDRRTDLSLDVAAPVASIRVLSGPSRPTRRCGRSVSWRAVSHLSLNYLSLVQSTRRRALRRCVISSNCMPQALTRAP